jgi:L-lactate dehydrogenase complex protein LldG
MSNKDEILNNIRKNTKTVYGMPKIVIDAIQYPDIRTKFMESMELVGGKAIELKQDEDINQCIRELYPTVTSIVSNIPGITIANINPDRIVFPNELDGTDLAVVKGEIGVAENGSVWISRVIKEKALYFVSENLIILLDKKDLVHNMHEAYQRVEMTNHDFGVFISGPSKTADIEQTLVIGAHGARDVTVILQI